MTKGSSREYFTIADAAELIGRSVPTVYRWTLKPEKLTGIRRMRIGRFTYLHLPSLREYEATVQVGRPRKGAPEGTSTDDQHTPTP